METNAEREFAAVVRLLDDDSEVVQRAVVERLRAWESALPELWRTLDPPATPDQVRAAQRLLRESRADTLPKHWTACLRIADPMTRLETGLGLLADFLDGAACPSGRLTRALNGLADELRPTPAAQGAMALVHALFGEERFQGDRSDYYALENSSLMSLLSRGRANPISLVCLLMLVGHRLGLSIGGCNYPGHFLALAPEPDGVVIVDCFHLGRVVSLKELLQPDPDCFPEVRQALLTSAPTNVILLRVLRNVHRALEQAEESRLSEMMDGLIEETINASASH